MIKFLVLLVFIFINTACSEKAQENQTTTVTKPELLKTQLETLDKAKQLQADAKVDAAQQQEKIDELTK